MFFVRMPRQENLVLGNEFKGLDFGQSLKYIFILII